jgi:photosystem II stability/assembly factor-like uncharacterized protein
MIKLFFYCTAFLLSLNGLTQTVTVLTKGNGISVRGLSVVDDNTVWVSGHKGTVGKSLDGGKTWQWKKVKGFDSTDFRDIEAFSSTEAIIMGISEPAYILKTNDGGDTWKVVYENKTKGMFLDAMEFWNEQSGIIIGDPINGRFFITRTFDGGNSWQDLPFDKRPVADSGEACFAASGTNIRAFDKDEACFITGGLRSRFYSKKTPLTLPVMQGTEMSGANSIAIGPKKKTLVVVSGDYNQPRKTDSTCAVSFDKGLSWQLSTTPPNGYRSCVEFIKDKQLIACGLTGVDVSADGGLNWKSISTDGFHVCRKAKNGKAVFLAGANGKIGKLEKVSSEW